MNIIYYIIRTTPNNITHSSNNFGSQLELDENMFPVEHLVESQFAANDYLMEVRPLLAHIQCRLRFILMQLYLMNKSGLCDLRTLHNIHQQEEFKWRKFWCQSYAAYSKQENINEMIELHASRRFLNHSTGSLRFDWCGNPIALVVTFAMLTI